VANGRNTTIKGDKGRDGGGFIALPWSVLDCPAYAGLSHIAKSMLLEVARQFVRDNNGRMLLSTAYMKKRGWFSADVIQKAKLELIEAGFIFETVKGHRPNKASWYAVTWRNLDKLIGYDEGAEKLFKRGAYRFSPGKPKRPPLNCKKPKKIKELNPQDGTERALIAPPHGIRALSVIPPHGAIRCTLSLSSIPPHGNHLEMPSIANAASSEATIRKESNLDKTIRVRDCEIDSKLFDAETGEFHKPPTTHIQNNRAMADNWVKAALSK